VADGILADRHDFIAAYGEKAVCEHMAFGIHRDNRRSRYQQIDGQRLPGGLLGVCQPGAKQETAEEN
jgi:hypothetical protein